MSNLLLDVTDQLQSSSPSSKYPSSNNKNENTRNFGKRKNLKKNPKLQSLDAPSLLLCRGIYRRYRKQNPSITLPRKLVTNFIQMVAKTRHSRVSATIAWPMATRFLAWPLLVRSSGLLLDFVFKPSILRTRDNLGSKLSQIRIYKRICSLSLSFSPLLSLSLYCKQLCLSRSPSYPFPPPFSNQEFYIILSLPPLDFKNQVQIRLDKVETSKLLQLIQHVSLWDSWASLVLYFFIF